MANGDAKQVVAKYLALKKPGYALMLDAPWGSGKTHFIGKVTDYEANETRLYVSLFNVHTTEEFEWALVRALKPWTEQTEKWGRRISEFVRGVTVAGCSVDLTKVNMTEIALDSLPDTLVFDDVERCGIKPKQLWGLINGFVEHEGKRVILVCNSVKGEKKKQLAAIREKLVGQVVTIEPDIEAALTTVLRETQLFQSVTARPDWVRFWKWGEEAESDLIQVEARVDRKISDFTLTIPGEILQIYAAKRFKGEFLNGFCPKENARAFWNYIQELGRRELLPARLPAATRDREAYGFDAEFGCRATNKLRIARQSG